MDAFDSDVLIYAANGERSGRKIAALLAAPDSVEGCIGSVLLLPEVLSHPIRSGKEHESRALQLLLGRLSLKAVDFETALLATTLGAKYRLRAADAVHLATAILWGAERFHTNNRKDFGPHIEEIEVVLP